MLRKSFLAMVFLSSLPGMAVAADNLMGGSVEASSHDGAFTFIGGVGYTFLQAEERVYDGAGNRISELFWESEAPVLTGSLRARFAGPWTLSASATVGFAGNSWMEDYDWLDASPSFAFDDWSDHSIHPDTELHHYFTGDIALGRDFQVNRAVTLNLHGGFKYTDVKWTAYGGSYVYSEDGYRDDTGSLPNGERSISYQQRFPGVFLGAETTATHNNWTISIQARGGLNFEVEDEDHHWARDLRFEDDYGTLPFLSLSGRVEYKVTDKANLFLAGSFEQHFDKIGDVRIYQIPTGGLVGTSEDGAGLEFRSFTLSGGFKAKF